MKKIVWGTSAERSLKAPDQMIQVLMTAVCVILAALPIIVSVTVQPDLLESSTGQLIEVLDVWGVHDYWLQIISALGTVALLLIMFSLLLKVHGRTELSLPDGGWIKVHWLPICLLLVLCWAVLSMFTALDRQLAYWGDIYCAEGLQMFLFYAGFFGIAAMVKPRHMRIVAETMSATCAGTGVMLLLAQHGILTDWFYLQGDLRAMMFHNNNHYGYFLALCLPLAFGLALQDQFKSRTKQALRFAEVWLICNTVAYNSVRGSFLAIACVFVCWNVYVLSVRRTLWKRLLLLDGLVLCTLAFLNTGSQLWTRFGVLQEELSTLTQSTDAAVKENVSNDLGSGRGELWKLGIQFAGERPLLGYGPANLLLKYEEYGTKNWRPHNDLILIAASMGIPALLFYVCGLAGHLVTFLRNLRKMTVLEVTVFSSVGSYLISSMTGNSYYYTTPYFYMMLGFSFAICKAYSGKTAEPDTGSQ